MARGGAVVDKPLPSAGASGGGGGSARSPLANIFSQYWLQSQILPNGLPIVTELKSPAAAVTPDVLATNKKFKFDPLSAMKRPEQYATDDAEGYAQLLMNITRGVCEMYTPVPKQPTGVAAASTGDWVQTKPVCPPFFPTFRVFINDRPVYQTRVAHLEPAVIKPSGGPPDPTNPNLAMINEDRAGEASPEEARLKDDEEMALTGTYELTWNEQCKMWLYSPASVITLQLLEKDFCPDPSASEDVLASLSMPLACCAPNQSIDMVVNVYCTLPEAYSLEALTQEADRVARIETKILDAGGNPLITPVAPSPEQLRKCPATSLVCRIHISFIILPQWRSGLYRYLGEIAALGLPRGPWTPRAVASALNDEDQLSILAGSDLLMLGELKEGVTLVGLIRAVSSLVYCCTTGLDDLPPAEVVKGLGDIQDIDQRKLTYVRMAEDAVVLIEYLVWGPWQHLTDSMAEITTFRRPMVATAVLVFAWAAFTLRTALAPSTVLACLLLLFYLCCAVHMPRVPKSRLDTVELLGRMSSISGAQMLIKPIEQALLRPKAVKRLRLLELWISNLMKIVVEHPHTIDPPSFSRIVTRFLRNPIRVAPILLLALSSYIRGLIGYVAAACLTGFFLRKTETMVLIWSGIRGVRRYNKVRKLRNAAHEEIPMGAARSEQATTEPF